MKQYRYLMYILILVFAMSVSGCSKEDEKENENTNEAVEVEQEKDDVVDGKIVSDAVMLTVSDREVTYSEVMVYVNMIRDKYEPLFSEYIWNFKVDVEKSFEDMAKEEIINQIVRLKIMNAIAQDRGIGLSEDEKLDIQDSAAEYLTHITQDDQERYGINLDIVRTIYEDNVIAQKLFDVVTGDVETNVSKEESHTITLKQFAALYYGRDRDGNILNKTKEQKAAAKEDIIKAYDQIVRNKNDFITYADNHSDLDAVVIAVSKGEFKENIEKELFKLKEGETSIALDLGDGFYFFECISADDKKAREERINEIVKERQNEMFSKEYNKWLQESKVYIVTNLWNMIKF